ncbi:WD repeat-containing and planar cell polarity effector protein fritz isoform X1 [Colias croceus]|uniref:WD repeat-containing and planar cell polarity effector protein fritz isoform X1 n=1 Tax=Colias crocea TaxID=72248 RepID=UPI001E279E2E|nr:WD repeat-containing and planar cell polarity effector protein fritz isoform X1 [Colias croceus]
MFSYDVKFLTCDDSVFVKNSDLKSYKYEAKKKFDETVYDNGKRMYCERRGGHVRAPRVNHIRQLESKLRDWNIVASEWINDSLATLVFSSGVIAHITINPTTLDVTQILFDRYCLGKLMGNTVTGVVLSRTHLLFIHPERIATLIVFGKKNDHVPCRISDRDPHLQSLDLGGSSRKTDRHVSWCQSSTGLRVLVWSNNIADPAPWSPLLEDHANLHLYNIEGQQVSLIAFHQIEGEVLIAELSQKNNSIHIVEQATCHKNGVNLFWLRYDVPKSDRVLQLSSLHEKVTQVSLSSPVRIARRSPCDARLLTACIDGSVHIIHNVAGLTHSIRAGFIATDVRWAGELVIASEETGRLQCFDRALSLLHHHTKCLDLTSHLRDTRRIQILGTRSFKGGPLILATFSGGPLTLLRISHPRLLTAWLRSGRPSNSIELLKTLDWEEEGDQCLHGISEIVISTLRKNTFDVNAESAIQGALGVYLAPTAPLPPSASRYSPPIHDLARKFFHHLLRRGRIEKAMSLAVELEAWDLFADAQWAATRARQHQLAQEAAACATHYAPRTHDSECSDSCSQCSSHSYSESEDEHTHNGNRKINPPPLPRVPFTHPTVLSVPIAQNDPPSTNSIRPNLHQYLDRDNTIWTTNIKDDSYISKTYDRDLKPSSNQQNMRWNSVDVLNFNMNTSRISEGFVKPTSEVIQKPYNERMASTHFNHLFRADLKDDVPNTYRYTSSLHLSNTNFNERYRQDKTVWPGSRPAEKNKVKFSDTVTIAVVPEQPQSEVARELADSLPLCPPNKYLAAFTPQASKPYDEPRPLDGEAQRNPPKIKVVHFGMV